MEYKILALGAAGGIVCQALLSKGVDSNLITHFHTDSHALKVTGLGHPILVGNRDGMRCCGFDEVTEEIFNEQLELFERAIESDVLYIIVCGLGGSTGTNLAVNLSKLLAGKNKKFTVIATLPFGMEGQKKSSKAISAFLEIIPLAGDNFIPLSMDDIAIPCKNLIERFSNVDQCVATVVKGIIMKCESFRFRRPIVI